MSSVLQTHLSQAEKDMLERAEVWRELYESRVHPESLRASEELKRIFAGGFGSGEAARV